MHLFNENIAVNVLLFTEMLFKVYILPCMATSAPVLL